MTDVTDEQIDRLEELEARIDAIESREAIESLHASFVRDVADRRFDELAGYFAPDAVIDMRGHGPRQGTAEIDEHFQGMEAVPLLGAGYVLSSPVVVVDGDHATGRWTWHRFHSSAQVAGRPVRVWGVWEEGRYWCEYVRTPEGWRFAVMRFRMVRPDPDPDLEAVGMTEEGASS